MPGPGNHPGPLPLAIAVQDIDLPVPGRPHRAGQLSLRHRLQDQLAHEAHDTNVISTVFVDLEFYSGPEKRWRTVSRLSQLGLGRPAGAGHRSAECWITSGDE